MATTLPVVSFLKRIVAAISRGHVVLQADPGAGKTTQVPPALLQATRGEILVSQPRRIAARLAARRVAQEQGVQLGNEIGYAVRHERKASKATRLLYCTEGVLIRRLINRPQLPGVDVVVLDEFHERSLHADMSLALLQRITRSDFRLVVMSATLDAGPLAKLLGAEVISVPGRLFPVEVEFRGSNKPLAAQVAAAARDALAQEGGDVLVFLPGAAEIRAAQKSCGQLDADVLPLHGDLPPSEQDRAVKASPKRRVILSTNIAESSVTLPQVTTVIDSGLARRPMTSKLSGLSILQTFRISQASAIQRAGRAGRVQAGQCVRLYSRADFERRPAFDPPEILRSDLSELALAIRHLGLEPDELSWVDPPPNAALEQAHQLLAQLGGWHREGLSPLGKAMIALPLHPRLSRIVLESIDRDVGSRGCAVAALLANRDLRLRPPEFPEPCRSDLLLRLEELEACEALRDRPQTHGLNPATFRTVQQTRRQLQKQVRVSGEPEHSLEMEEDALALSILAGFPDRVGSLKATRVAFAFGGGGELHSSSQVGPTRLLVATEATQQENKPLQIRQATRVDAEDVLDIFPHLVEEREALRLDDATGRVVRTIGLYYGRLVLDESTKSAEPTEESAHLLADAAATALSNYVDLDELEQLRRRIGFAVEHGLALKPITDELIREALLQLCRGHRSLQDVRRQSLIQHLLALQEPNALARLRQFAPETIALPGRKRVPVNYEAERPPWIASRLQDFFGLSSGPRIADNQVALVLHLQAPNRRAVQVTTDLGGFWMNHYPKIRKELMRRYSRHAWPADPLHPSRI